MNKVSPINADTLSRFLKEKKNSSYANKDAAKTPSSRLKSQDYHFEKDGLIYHDTFFGDRDFIGEEIVYSDQKPIWGANYFGFILANKITEKEVYDFLQAALMQEDNAVIPVRGPRAFSERDWTYRFSAEGELSNFTGQEEILLKGQIVYRLLVHGGFIR